MATYNDHIIKTNCFFAHLRRTILRHLFIDMFNKCQLKNINLNNLEGHVIVIIVHLGYGPTRMNKTTLCIYKQG